MDFNDFVDDDVVDDYCPVDLQFFNCDKENNNNSNDNVFKLPPRLAARLLKKYNHNNNSNESKIATVNRHKFSAIHNLDLINDQNGEIINENNRRQTMVIRSNKRKEIEAVSICSSESNGENLSNKPMDDTNYVEWINSIFATSFLIENINVDTARIINDCIMSKSTNYSDHCSTGKEPVLKDGITSIAYREEQMMNLLREKAVKFYQFEEITLAKEALLEDVKLQRYFIRKDRSIHIDVGSKKHILEIFLKNYNPLWLKVALETIFNGRINNRNEFRNLVQFLTHHLLSFKEMAKRRNKNVTTYFMNENNVRLAKEHILFYFILIVHFLDVAKRNRLIDHDPCLFRKNAECKSSRDIVVSFSRDYITGVGDITKSLRNAGIHLIYVQNPIEEFNFTVNYLSEDIRCGLRLARILEIIYQRNDILPLLLYPSDNITRKLHNMQIVFRIMEQAGINMNCNGQVIVPKDICIGNRMKTLYLLDCLMKIYDLRQRELEYQKSLNKIVIIQRAIRGWIATRRERSDFLHKKSSCIIIQRFYRLYCSMKKCRQEFLLKKRAAIKIQSTWRGTHQRKYFIRLRQNVITVQRRFRANLEMKICRRKFLLDRQSAIRIQIFYRSYCLMKKYRQEFLSQKQAAITIQANWRKYHQRSHYLKLRQSVLRIQRLFRANQEMKRCRELFRMKRQSAIKIQRFYRSYCQTVECRREFLLKKHAAVTLQKNWRRYYLAKRYNKLRQSVITIQKLFRANREMRKCFKNFQLQRYSAIKIQNYYRSYCLMKKYRQEFLSKKHASITIQCYWRRYQAQKHYNEMRRYVIIVQRRFRANQLMKKDYNHMKQLKMATIFVQKRFRQNKQFNIDRNNYKLMKSSSIIIQSYWRKYCERTRYITLRQSVVKIQQLFRANQEMKKCRKEYELKRQSVIKIQRYFRAYCLMRKCREEFLLKKRAAITIQKNWRRHCQQGYYLKLRQNVIIIQRLFRANRLMKIDYNHMQRLRWATIFIQKRFRQNKQFTIDYNNYQLMKKSASIIQLWFRNLQKKSAIIKWQTLVMTVFTEYKQKRRQSAILIQKTWRGFIVRKHEKFVNFQLIRERLEYANNSATENKKLINIVEKSIERYRSKARIDLKQRELEIFEMATTYSNEICQILIQSDWLMFELINSLDFFNRSEPHKKLIGQILGIIINILTKTDSKYFHHDESLEKIIILLRNFPRSPSIIHRCLIIINFLLNNKKLLKFYKQNSYLMQILEQTMKKYATDHRQSTININNNYCGFEQQFKSNQSSSKFKMTNVCAEIRKKIF